MVASSGWLALRLETNPLPLLMPQRGRVHRQIKQRHMACQRIERIVISQR